MVGRVVIVNEAIPAVNVNVFVDVDVDVDGPSRPKGEGLRCSPTRGSTFTAFRLSFWR